MSSIQELPNSKKGGHPETNPCQEYDFQAANEHYAKHLHKPDPIVGARSRVGIITCADARCIPEKFFELTENEAFVIRNGGGRTATEDVIRTLLLIQVLSEVKELKIVHHTGKMIRCCFGHCCRMNHTLTIILSQIVAH
jgi:carbonic anhydrase